MKSSFILLNLISLTNNKNLTFKKKYCFPSVFLSARFQFLLFISCLSHFSLFTDCKRIFEYSLLYMIISYISFIKSFEIIAGIFKLSTKLRSILYSSDKQDK